MNNETILVVDDEKQIRKLLEITLQSNGYNILEASTAQEGLTMAVNHNVDLIILDLGLPDSSGAILLKKLREWFVKPIIILSVQNNEEAIIDTLDYGANDYLVKPFRTGELLARIRSALRNASLEANTSVIKFKTFELDLSARIIKLHNEALKLTATQYTMLVLFGKNEGKVLTHQYLLKEIWGEFYTDKIEYLRVFVAQLRKKIEIDNNRYIFTESGIGYRFVATSIYS